MLYSLDSYVGSGSGYPITISSLCINYSQEPISRPVSYFYEWFYCVEGKGLFIINNERFILEKGQICYVIQNVPVSYKGLTDDWTVNIISATGSCAKSILNTLSYNTPGIYNPLNKTFFQNHIRKLHNIISGNIPDKDLELTKACYDFLLDFAICTEFLPQHQSHSKKSKDEIIHQICKYLEDNFDKDFSLNELAAAIGLSRSYMCSLFKSEMNQTIISNLNGLRISHARRYLSDYPEKSIKEIGKMCGFSNYSYFITTFRNINHMTPMQFRLQK